VFGTTKWGKCDGASFTVQAIEPSGAAYKQIAIQCTACRVPIGITGFYDAGSLIKKQEKTIADLQRTVNDIQQYVHQITHAMRR